MPKGMKFTEEQIIAILKQADAGARVQDLCRQHNVSDATFYKWKAKFSGMDVSDAKRLKGLENENTRLKHIVADLTLDNKVLKELLSKKF
jgi:putative transposase